MCLTAIKKISRNEAVKMLARECRDTLRECACIGRCSIRSCRPPCIAAFCLHMQIYQCILKIQIAFESLPIGRHCRRTTRHAPTRTNITVVLPAPHFPPRRAFVLRFTVNSTTFNLIDSPRSKSFSSPSQTITRDYFQLRI